MKTWRVVAALFLPLSARAAAGEDWPARGPLTIALSGFGPEACSPGDFDGDVVLEVAVAGSGPEAAGKVMILFRGPSGRGDWSTTIFDAKGPRFPPEDGGKREWAQSKGSTTFTPACLKSRTFRVTTVRSWTSAVAAIRLSLIDMDRPKRQRSARSLAQRRP